MRRIIHILGQRKKYFFLEKSFVFRKVSYFWSQSKHRNFEKRFKSFSARVSTFAFLFETKTKTK